MKCRRPARCGSRSWPWTRGSPPARRCWGSRWGTSCSRRRTIQRRVTRPGSEYFTRTRLSVVEVEPEGQDTEGPQDGYILWALCVIRVRFLDVSWDDPATPDIPT